MEPEVASAGYHSCASVIHHRVSFSSRPGRVCCWPLWSVCESARADRSADRRSITSVSSVSEEISAQSTTGMPIANRRTRTISIMSHPKKISRRLLDPAFDLYSSVYPQLVHDTVWNPRFWMSNSLLSPPPVAAILSTSASVWPHFGHPLSVMSWEGICSEKVPVTLSILPKMVTTTEDCNSERETDRQ